MSDQRRARHPGLVSRSLAAFRHTTDAAPTSAREPCVGCGEETAVGSVFFSDRFAVPGKDGAPSYLCSICDARVRSSRKGRRLTDEEVANAVRNGSAAAIAWSSGGPNVGF